MNLEIKLIGEIAELQPVLNVLANGNTKTVAPAGAKNPTPKAAPVADADEEEEKPAKAAAPAPKAAPKPAAKAPAPKAAPKPKAEEADEAVDFDDMDEEAQLAEIVKVATRFTKKGKTNDIKKLLTLFDAPKASSLDAAVYSDFFGLLTRYADGEDVDALVDEFSV